MADSLAQVRSDLANLIQRVNALVPSQQPFNKLSMNDDVNIGAITPLADKHGLVYNATQGAWTNAAATSGFPVGPQDDTNATYSITIPVSQELLLKTLLDATPTINAQIQEIVTTLGASTSVIANSAGGAAFVTVNSAVTGGGNIVLGTNTIAVTFIVVNANPNGSVSGSKGDVAFDIATPQIWVNTTGAMVWVNP